MSYKVFGSVEINCLTAPTTFDDFANSYSGKIPNIKEAFDVICKEKEKAGLFVVKTGKKKRKRNGKTDTING